MPSTSSTHPDDIIETQFAEMVDKVREIDAIPKIERPNEWNWNNAIYMGIVHDRRNKNWEPRPVLPVSGQGNPSPRGDCLHYLPIPQEGAPGEGTLSMVERWAADPVILTIILLDRMLYGTMDDVTNSLYHPAPKWLVTKTLVKIKHLFREYWYMQEEDIEAIYQEEREQRAQDLINAGVQATVPFDGMLGLVMHIKLGHFKESSNPAAIEVPVREGCFPWIGGVADKVRTSRFIDRALARGVPTYWSKDKTTFIDWWQRMHEEDPDFTAHPAGPGGPLGLEQPFMTEPFPSPDPDADAWDFTSWTSVGRNLQAPPGDEN